MTTGPEPTRADEAARDPVELLAEEFAGRCRRGERPSIGDYADRHPEHAEKIRELFPALAMIEQLGRHRRVARASATAAAGGDAPPERVGDFRILREVGRGGMGIVYEAVQESLGRRVALKVLPRHSLLDPRRLRRFEREALAAARLHHTNIVPIFGVGDQAGLHYIAMQLIEGRGLNRIIADRRRARGLAEPDPTQAETGPQGDQPPSDPKPEAQPEPEAQPTVPDDPSWRFAARVGVQVAEALQYAHDQGVLHRDIKPANLLLDGQGVVWVADFGLAKLAGDDGLTATGDLVGTMAYIPPEAIDEGAEAGDGRVDLYGLGLTLYELLTLEPGFADSNPTRLLRKILQERPVPPRRRDPSIPRDLETVVLKAIERNPAHRYATARDLADDLRRVLEDRPVAARRVSPAERLWRWARRNRGTAALSATAAASLLLAAVVGWAGYATTRRALDRESTRRDEAEAATRRAEENVALSLAAFEDIFRHITGRDDEPIPGFDPGPPGPPPFDRFDPGRGRGPGPNLGFRGGRGPRFDPDGPPGGDGPGRPRGGDGPPASPDDQDDAALIQSVLRFYDDFAARNSTDAALQREAARAHRRVADLYDRLGRRDEAGTSRDRAASLYLALIEAGSDRPADRIGLAEIELERPIDPDDLAGVAARAGDAADRIADLADAPMADPGPVALRARLRIRQGEALGRLGQPDAAAASLGPAVSALDGLAGLDRVGTYYRLDLARARRLLAACDSDAEEAGPLLEAARLDLRAVRDDRRRSPRLRDAAADELAELARAFRDRGEPGRADEMEAWTRDLFERRPPIPRGPRPPGFGPDGPRGPDDPR